MTRTEERLADALGAVAAAVPEETLRPLVAPPPPRPRPVWLAPAAAAASVVVLAGLVTAAVAVAGSGAGKPAGPPPVPAAALAAVPRYYAEADLDQRITVRSTATSKVTATLPIRGPLPAGLGAVAAAGHGLFFAAGVAPHSRIEQLYRFRVTAAGKVTGLTPVPGGRLSARQRVDGLAAAPGGASVALSYSTVWHGNPSGPDRLIVIDTKTGARTVWRGGTRGENGRNGVFGVASMSWTGDGQRLAVLGQWCPGSGSHAYAETNIFCQGSGGQAHRVAEVWLIRPADGGGLLSRGQLLLRQSDRYPYLAQALISPDGRVLTAMVLTGPVVGQNPGGDGTIPDNMTIRQIAVPSGRPLGVLYRRHLGSTFETGASPDFLGLTGDSTRQHWIVIAELGHDPFNGWLYRGRLVPLINVTGLNDPGFEAW
jgi:hypothetical protein